jgi:hypothetical protein
MIMMDLISVLFGMSSPGQRKLLWVIGIGAAGARGRAGHSSRKAAPRQGGFLVFDNMAATRGAYA